MDTLQKQLRIPTELLRFTVPTIPELQKESETKFLSFEILTFKIMFGKQELYITAICPSFYILQWNGIFSSWVVNLGQPGNLGYSGIRVPSTSTETVFCNTEQVHLTLSHTNTSKVSLMTHSRCSMISLSLKLP